MYFELGYIKLYIDFESAEYCKPTPDNNGGYLNWFEDDIDEDDIDEDESYAEYDDFAEE